MPQIKGSKLEDNPSRKSHILYIYEPCKLCWHEMIWPPKVKSSNQERKKRKKTQFGDLKIVDQQSLHYLLSHPFSSNTLISLLSLSNEEFEAQWMNVLLMQWSWEEFEISMELSFFKVVGKNWRGLKRTERNWSLFVKWVLWHSKNL